MKITLFIETEAQQIQRKITETLNLEREAETNILKALKSKERELNSWFSRHYIIESLDKETEFNHKVIASIRELRSILKQQLTLADPEF